MIICNICQGELREPAAEHWTRCMQCGHEWELTDDDTQIKSVTVTIQSVKTVISASQMLKRINKNDFIRK